MVYNSNILNTINSNELIEPIVLNTNPEIVFNTSLKADKWILDSGSSIHLCSNRDMFEELRPIRTQVHWGNGPNSISTPVLGIGRIHATFLSTRANIVLNNVFYVPSLKVNILSCGILLNRNYTLYATKSSIDLLDNKNKKYIIASSYLKYNLTIFGITPSSYSIIRVLKASSKEIELDPNSRNTSNPSNFADSSNPSDPRNPINSSNPSNSS